MTDRYVLVLAGGLGERFWPWSRPGRPKQLLPLAADGRTLLAATLERALRIVPTQHIVILTSADLVPEISRQCPGVTVLGEPVPRNTAPAIAAAAAWIGHDAAFAVMPADHAIDEVDAFAADLEKAFKAAESEKVLVTFGIRPRGAETNFGYIKVGTRLGDRLNQVARFREKPDLANAQEWTRTGDHLWNSGIFVWRCSVFMDALAAAKPEIARVFRELAQSGGRDNFEDRLRHVLPGVESISVDYAVLEQAPNTVVIEASFDWDDLGSWGAWARRQPRDPRGNVLYGDAVAIDCDGCVVVGEGGPAAAVGLRDTVVVNANGSTLSCPVERSDQVRRVSEALRARRGT
jgi:mannose-1-phosphate guanylyltransferase/mannose-6-phosphate isomerase